VWVHGADADWVEAPAPFNPALFGNPPPTPGVTPDRLLAEGDVLEVGDLRLAVLETPGHSPGCIVAHDAESGQAIVGDLIFAQGIGRTDFPRSDPAAMMASLERALALPADTRIYPGHGPWGGTVAEAAPFARMFM
jgi:glyoxylase-like metal-dependent hydrolase (beta-lactamase superfamily II)